ncbi:MAG: PqqD family protein [Acetobacter sp.]|nr:PqqD family protein [Bacteroides sp.]MCM1342129.1 PqqD family protein [Acetobacter sp.]MCM1434348.1 PqqD family protein [Clostridiales bacterium]
MKIKKGFAKREIAGSTIVVPVGTANKEFNGMITLNHSASFFWDCFCKDISIDKAVQMVVNEYDIDEQTARKDIENFVNMLKENNLLE